MLSGLIDLKRWEVNNLRQILNLKMSNVLLVLPEKPDVVVAVELGHFILSRFVGPRNN